MILISKHLKAINLLLLCVLFNSLANAQSWSIPAKSGEMQLGSVVYIGSVYQRPGAPVGVNDTIGGTALILTDSNRFYLVTAKHLVQASLAGKGEQLINKRIFIMPSWEKGTKPINLPPLGGRETAIKPYILSPDKEDIAILSLQKGKYKNILPALLKNERRPFPVDSMDVSENHYPDDSFFHTFCLSFSEKGNRIWQNGLAPGKIKKYDKKQTSFITGDFFAPNYSGSPIFVDDKVIGIMINSESIFSNMDALRTPRLQSKTALVIKAAYLLHLLRKLQQNENTPGFN